MISYQRQSAAASPGTTFTRGFRVWTFGDDLGHVAGLISRYAWSPVIWRDGYRAKANFLSAALLALDFDSPTYSLAQALRDFCDTQHVIGTTRNHQREKGGIVCDRFRVVVPFEQPITDRATFEHTMRLAVEKWDSDPACIDAGRHYFPCREIVSVATDGYRADVHVPPPPAAPRSYPQHPTALGPWTLRQLSQVVPMGKRHNTFWAVAKDMLRVGFTEGEIFGIVVRSSTYQGQVSPEVERDLREVIASANVSLAREIVDGGSGRQQ